MYSHNEILPFDGTLQGLLDQLELLKATMPKRIAFVQDTKGNILNRVRVNVKQTAFDYSPLWDIEIFKGVEHG